MSNSVGFYPEGTTVQNSDPAVAARLKMLEKMAQRRAIETQETGRFSLNPERRSENLRLLRAYMGGSSQENFRRMLKISSQATYSNHERGDPPLSVEDARRIELDLKLPKGWFERNNTDALFLGGAEFDLVQEMKECAPNATSALLTAVRSIRTQRG